MPPSNHEAETTLDPTDPSHASPSKTGLATEVASESPVETHAIKEGPKSASVDGTQSGSTDKRETSTGQEKVPANEPVAPVEVKDEVELDDFGLPIRVKKDTAEQKRLSSGSENTENAEDFHEAAEGETYAQRTDNQNKSTEPRESTKDDGLTEERGELKPPGYKETTGEDTCSELPAYDEEKVQESSEAAAAPADKMLSTLNTGRGVSEWSHQQLAPHKDDDVESNHSDTWQDMPALGALDVYDDFGRLVARGVEEEDEEAVYRGLGGAGKGYTRVQLDDDAKSATSMDEDTSYLFKDPHGMTLEEDEEQRDALSQLQATKDLLTEGQKIAYVGVTRLTLYLMVKELEDLKPTKGTKKIITDATESMAKWSQQMMVRLYAHMEIDSAEQVMIEQLAEHGVQPGDLVSPLMQNARVKNPLNEDHLDSPKPSSSSSKASPNPARQSTESVQTLSTVTRESLESPPPPYEAHLHDDEMPEIRTPSQLATSKKIDVDIRWTVLCDLFLVLIAEGVYDSRSRTLLERVGEAMEVSWMQICRFEKRVIDALEMQEEANKENWDEADNMEKRRKMALKRKYMIMGLATVGGGLVIGLSAGLLAPVIGAGLAAGFTTVGISGTSAFLGGTGGAALITSGATLAGTSMGVRASHRRTGAVQTFEYRPLHNNKRVNLIVTVSGWMSGKVDDVRLPYSVVDPVMGDLYSVLWEPEMLQSMGQTINILATEALTQGLQQVLGSTILVALMASLQLPVVLSKLSYLIDNPWNVSLGRANAAGLILADSLVEKNLGNRPVTLLGFSLGSRVIFSCLKELSKKGAYGLVQNVYLFGSPNVANHDDYMRARTVVSGRFVNGYSTNDWILGYLFRATGGGIMRVAGLAPVMNIPGLENIDVTHLVNGHMAYRSAMPRLLKHVGWDVISDDFTEIEDPDPENHEERQRELIREIDEARREAETKPEKKRFGLFKRGKLAEKKKWETYDPDRPQDDPRGSTDSTGQSNGVLFDIDAIRAELAGEQIEVRQLESTLPPIKIDLNSPTQPESTSSSSDARPNLRQTQSSEATLPSQDHAYNAHHEEDMQMTFDTSYSTPPRSYSVQPEESHSSGSNRPVVTSSTTLPVAAGVAGLGAGLGAVALESNAWADDEFGGGGGGDGEIQMSFE